MLARILLALVAATIVFFFSYSFYLSDANVSSIARASLQKTVRFLEKSKQESGLRPGVDPLDFESQLNKIRGYLNAAQHGEPFGKRTRIFSICFLASAGLVALAYLAAGICAWRIPGRYSQYMKMAFTVALVTCIMLYFSARYQLSFAVQLYYDLQSAEALMPGQNQLPNVDEMLSSASSVNIMAIVIALQMAFFIFFAPFFGYMLINRFTKKTTNV